MTSDRDAGFTLVETLVSLVVLGFIVAGLVQGLRFGMAIWDRQARGIDRDSALDSTDRTLRALLARMAPGEDPHQPSIQGESGRLLFTSELPANAPSNPTRIADIILGVDAAHRLVLRWTPHLHARLLRPAVPEVAILLPGVTRVTFGYFHGLSRGHPAGWADDWRGIDPPALVRVHIALADPSRHWPDVIVAPMRDVDSD